MADGVRRLASSFWPPAIGRPPLPVKTDRIDAAGLAQIIRTGWFRQVRIKSRDSYQARSLLVSRETLVQYG